jgi:hypothetical protein
VGLNQDAESRPETAEIDKYIISDEKKLPLILKEAEKQNYIY